MLSSSEFGCVLSSLLVPKAAHLRSMTFVVTAALLHCVRHIGRLIGVERSFLDHTSGMPGYQVE